jgi:hypothetical protein
MAGSLVSSKRRGVWLAGWFSRSRWKMVDPLYIWSAAAGFLVALVLIVIASIMQTGRLR